MATRAARVNQYVRPGASAAEVLGGAESMLRSMASCGAGELGDRNRHRTRLAEWPM